MNTPQDNVSTPVVTSADVHACTKQTPYYRLNAQALKQDYKLGLITATGYLYYIVKVSRKDGWLFAIDDVTAFCKEWGLKRGTFYDAKAKCVTLGLLKETIHGRVILQAETPVISINISSSVENPTPVEILDECQNLRQESEILDSNPPESQSPRDLPDAYRSSTDPLTDLSQFKPKNERETLDVDEDQLLKFTESKVKQSSEIKRPRAYAKKCLKDDRAYWIEEFRKWQNDRSRIDVPIESPPSTVFVAETIEQKRSRLLKLWNTIPCRPGIKNAIEAQPDLKLRIVEGELVEVEG